MKFRCPKCKKLYDVEKVNFSNWKCEQCGYQTNLVQTELKFERHYNKVRQITSTLRPKDEVIKELENGIVTEEERVLEIQDHIKILQERLKTVKGLFDGR